MLLDLLNFNLYDLNFDKVWQLLNFDKHYWQDDFSVNFWNLLLQSFFQEGLREMSSALMRGKKAKMKAWDMDASYVFEENPEKYSLTSCWLQYYRSTRPKMRCEKSVLRNFAKFTGKHLCQNLFFNKVAGLRFKACNFIKKETLAQVFSCEFCEIS